MKNKNYKNFAKAIAIRAHKIISFNPNFLRSNTVEDLLFKCAVWRLHRTTNVPSYHIDHDFWAAIKPMAIEEYNKISA